MTDILESRDFLMVWLSFTAVVLPGVVAAVIWGKRSGQFREGERVRKMPLLAHIPEEPDVGPSVRPSVRPDVGKEE